MRASSGFFLAAVWFTAMPTGAQVSARAQIAPDARVDVGARVDDEAVVESGARIEAGAHVWSAARIGAGVSLAAGAVVGPHTTVGAGSTIGVDAVVSGRTTIGISAHVGDEAYVGTHAIIGEAVSIGIGATVFDSAVIGDRVVIGDAAFVGSSEIGDDSRIDAGAWVGYRVEVGSGSEIETDTVVGTFVRLGEGVTVRQGARVWDRASVGDFAEIGDDTVVGHGADVGAEADLEENVFLYDGAVIGADSVLEAEAVVGPWTEIGIRAEIGAGAIIYGGVRVGDAAVIGGGATLREGVDVGDGASVALGVVIEPDARLAAGTTACRGGQDDADGDGVCSGVDLCPNAADPAQLDTDGDGLGDACDPCAADPADVQGRDGRCLSEATRPVARPAAEVMNDVGVRPIMRAAVERLARIEERPTTHAVTTAALADERLPGRALRFPLRPDRIVEASGGVASGGLQLDVWQGRFDDDEGDGFISLVYDDDGVHGAIIGSEGVFEIEPLGGSVHAITQLETDALLPDHPPGFEAFELAEAERHASAPAGPAGLPLGLPLEFGRAQGLHVNCKTIDVLVGYTDTVLARHPNILAFANSAIASGNQAHVNSQVEVRYRLVGLVHVDDDEDDGIVQNLDWLLDFNDGNYDEVPAERDAISADIAVLLVADVADACGIAGAILADDDDEAFAVVDESCAVGNLSFAHEIGHLQGARHNKEVDPSTTPYKHGHGRHRKSKKYRTVMSYQCSNNKCTRVPYWSNPDVKYKNRSTGTKKWRDNARVLDQTACTIAQHRIEPPAAGSMRLRHTQTGKCIYGNAVSGASVNNWGCWADPNMAYFVEPFDAATPNRVQLRHDLTGNCLFADPANGGLVRNAPCGFNPAHAFILDDAGGGDVRLRHEATSQCLYGTGTNGGNVHNWVCWNDPNMRFRIEPL